MNKTRLAGIALIILGLLLLAGCVTTTKVVVRHAFPDDHINYEISQEVTRAYWAPVKESDFRVVRPRDGGDFRVVTMFDRSVDMVR